MAETLSTFDPLRAESFAGKLLAVLNHGTLSLMVSIGHRTGLFDALKGLPPSTSEEIARHTGLNERYVREWLGAMVTGGLMEFNPSTRRYHLPSEHAAFLCRAAAADNMAVFAQYVAVLGGVEDDIVECFKKGGGVPYEKYPRFHAVMAEDSGQSVLSSLESHILPLVPGLTGRLASGIRALDVGCGSGRIVNRLAELYPASHFTGMDLSEEAIRTARAQASEKGLGNARFEVADLSDFDHTAQVGSFDFISAFDAVHDQAAPLRVLKGICRALKADGVFLMQDIRGSSYLEKNLAHPLGPLLYAVSCMHCMTVSLAQGGEGLGAMWGEEKAREYLREAGFRSVESHQLAHDIQNTWYVVNK
jgi:SAM-dependent methyltransferase